MQPKRITAELVTKANVIPKANPDEAACEALTFMAAHNGEMGGMCICSTCHLWREIRTKALEIYR